MGGAPLLRLQRPFLPQKGADAGTAEPGDVQVAGLGDGLTEMLKPPYDADVAAPSKGPKGSYVRPVMVLEVDRGENVHHQDRLPTLQDPLRPPDMLQWFLCVPAGTSAGAKVGLE